MLRARKRQGSPKCVHYGISRLSCARYENRVFGMVSNPEI